MPTDAEVLSPVEASLIRLLRRLGAEEREAVIVRVLGTLFGSPGGAAIGAFDPVAWQAVEDGLWRYWPADWPERRSVALARIPNPGSWLRSAAEKPWLRVLFTEPDDAQSAARLAASYAAQVRGGVSEASLRVEFAGFIRAWRARVFSAVESVAHAA